MKFTWVTWDIQGKSATKSDKIESNYLKKSAIRSDKIESNYLKKLAINSEIDWLFTKYLLQLDCFE